MTRIKKWKALVLGSTAAMLALWYIWFGAGNLRKATSQQLAARGEEEGEGARRRETCHPQGPCTAPAASTASAAPETPPPPPPPAPAAQGPPPEERSATTVLDHGRAAAPAPASVTAPPAPASAPAQTAEDDHEWDEELSSEEEEDLILPMNKQRLLREELSEEEEISEVVSEEEEISEVEVTRRPPTPPRTPSPPAPPRLAVVSLVRPLCRFAPRSTLLSHLKPKKMVDAAVMEKLEAGFKKMEASDSKSLLKKYLTRDVFDKLKNLKTPSFGSTLLDVIQSGVENPDSGVGIYAPDAEAYTVFADLFDPIIEDYHGGFKKSDSHPAKDWGDVDSLGNLDPTGEYIISTRVRCGRSMQGYPFNPCLTEAQYKEMEEKVSSTLSGFTGELKGTYYPLTGMTKEVQQKLIDDHFLFKEGDRFLQAANACRYWPSGRGIYHNDAKTFLVWCNEEDHLRLISMQMGGDLGQVYRRLVTAVNDIEKRVPFSHNDRLGFLTFCPTNLGTTVRASVHIKVPKLASNKAKLEEIAGKFNLQVRGTRGEHTEAEGGVYDISNKRRMGLTEYQAVKEMHDGIAELIKMEREL